MLLLLRTLLTVLALLSSVAPCRGFTNSHLSKNARQQQQHSSSTFVLHTADRRMGELTASETKVFDLLQTLHDSEYPFRIVVVGDGAILETTSVLGPALSVSQSPKTGKNLLTLASQDKSFEFHVSLADVSEICVLEKETPMKTMRLIRLLGHESKSLASLILADPSDAAVAWFHGIHEKYGESIKVA